MKFIEPGSRVYFIAIAGTGMSALAGLFKQRGCIVSGSDIACYPPVSDLLRNLSIPVCLSYDVEDLKKFGPDYVVIGNFVRRDNPQAQYVLENKIPYGSMPSTLEELFLKETKNFVVVGTHGKSTTTTALAHILTEAKRDPSYFVGAVSQSLKTSFHFGQGREFVLEGDEYDTAFFDKESKFLHYRPEVVLWTSLEFDHADIFPNMDRLELMFQKLMEKIPKKGCLIYCRDWERVHELVNSKTRDFSIRTYGFHPDSMFPIGEEIKIQNARMHWTLKGEKFESEMTGAFNAQNLSAAIVAAWEHGIDRPKVHEALRNFKGLKRRQELRAEKNSRRVIDDFAHHPTAVAFVLKALKEKYPNEKLVAFFEARSNTTRRKFFQKEFIEAFKNADRVYLPEVFKKEVLGTDVLDVSELVADLNKAGVKAQGPLSHEDLVNAGRLEIEGGPCTLAVLSNGSFDGLHEKLISLVNSQ